MGYQCLREIVTSSSGDSISDANCDLLEDLDDQDHQMLHIKGIPQDY